GGRTAPMARRQGRSPSESLQRSSHPRFGRFYITSLGWGTRQLRAEPLGRDRRTDRVSMSAQGLRDRPPVAPTRLDRGDARQFIGGFSQSVKPVEANAAVRADATPPANKQDVAEQGVLQRQGVKPRHVGAWIDTVQDEHEWPQGSGRPP